MEPPSSSSKPPPTPNATPTPQGGEGSKRARRRKKRSAGTGTGASTPAVTASASASGSATPLQPLQPPFTTDDSSAQPTELAKQPAKQTAKPSMAATIPQASFAGGEDFIAFGFSDPGSDEAEEEEEGAAGRQGQARQVDAKGKRKAREEEEDVGASPSAAAASRSTDLEGSSKKGRGRDERESRDYRDHRDDDDRRRRRSERDRSRDRSPPHSSSREWDKGKRARSKERVGHGRHYELVFDFDDDDDDVHIQRPYTRFVDAPGSFSKKAPWVTGIDWDGCKNVAEMLHREVEAFVHWISPTPVEDEIRGMIVTQISRAVKTNFPDAKVLPFGSYATKLYLPLGDIDLVIISDSMAWSDKVTVLHALANTLKRSGITSRVSIIAKAKVPIVKFVTTHGRFNVDISVNQTNGLLSGQIINGFLNHMHGKEEDEEEEEGEEGKKGGGGGGVALRSLVMITKAFLAQRSMNEVYTGGLGSYSIVCLAVSFLQMHPKIRRGEIDPEENLGVLVMEFFELYGCYFNYDEVGISLRNGGTYFSKRQRGWFDYNRRGLLLSVEDPADPSNDISKGSFAFHKVRTALAGAHSIMTSTAYLRAGIINSRRNGRAIHLRKEYEPEDLSILSTVMGITQETINHRRLVQELYDRRTLHNILQIKPGETSTAGGGSKDRDRGRSAKQQQQQQPPSSELKINGASVRLAWKEAEPDLELSDHEPSTRRPERNYHSRDADDDEDGRYSIAQPPRKRQKAGNEGDYHTVFVTDDDDEEDEEDYRDHDREYDSHSDGDSMDDEEEEEEEEEERGEGGKEREGRETRSGRPNAPRDSEELDKRRSYWLSKGIGEWESD